jgi:nucleotide-binding universal stress UspA family protein
MLTVVVVAAWLLIGCAVGFFMVRHGHSPYLWLVLVAFGPLAILFAIGARDDASRTRPTITRVGTTASGPLHVLAGIDGSSASSEAAAMALRLLDGAVGKVTLVAVLDIESPDTHPRGDAVQEADEWLRTAADLVAENVGVSAERVVLFGEPATELTEWAHAHDVHVIAVAARSHWTARHLLAGSVTRRVLQKSPCPVVVAPSGHDHDDLVIDLEPAVSTSPPTKGT